MSNKKIENLPICLLAAAPAMLAQLETATELLREIVDVLEADSHALVSAELRGIIAGNELAIRLAKGESQ